MSSNNSETGYTIRVHLSDEIENRIDNFINDLSKYFYKKEEVECFNKQIDRSCSLEILKTKDQLLLQFTGLSGVNKFKQHNVLIPIPFVEDGILFIQKNGVKRPLSNFYLNENNTFINYTDFLYMIFITTGNYKDILNWVNTDTINSDNSKLPFINRIINSFRYNDKGSVTAIINKLQKYLSIITNSMPLHEGNMSSWVTNNRYIIIDSAFNVANSPAEKVTYRTNLAKKFYSKGWTPIGLSDGSLVDKNYILNTDLRIFVPGGMYHNPQRNLYSTLNTKGSELPRVLTTSSKFLEDQNITRKGFNFTTAYIDLPDNFEDQLIVNNKYANTYITKENIELYYEELTINIGDTINYKDKVSKTKEFNILCDYAIIKDIETKTVNVESLLIDCYKVTFECFYYIKEGTKFTNLHGNKGVIVLKELGTAIHPVTKEVIDIDLAVSAKTIDKRKNFGQLIELIINNCVDIDTKDKTARTVLPDSYNFDKERILKEYTDRGFPEDGLWECNFSQDIKDTIENFDSLVHNKAIIGTVFWGVIKTAEEMYWTEDTIKAVNDKGLNISGVKYSTIEFRALDIIFGKDNPITEEIQSYKQGQHIIEEKLNILKSKYNKLNITEFIQFNYSDVKFIDQTDSLMVNDCDFTGTFLDTNVNKEGFILTLPIPHMIIIKDNKIIYEGSYYEERSEDTTVSILNSIYIPSTDLCTTWMHPSGQIGLNDISSLVNMLFIMCNRVVNSEQLNKNVIMMYHQAITSYTETIIKSLTHKEGDFNNFNLSVRYPNSIKAVATLSNSLAPNEVEIHKITADMLGIVADKDNYGIVERFPCFGFMSVRPQKIKITEDPQCRFVIRASKNSLVSTNLDYDGDTLFLSSFKTKEANECLVHNFYNPHKHLYKKIHELNIRKGFPEIKIFKLNEYNIKTFNFLPIDEYKAVVKKNISVKGETGPAVAMAYNLTRIAEKYGIELTRDIAVEVDMFLEKTGQSVMEQKHGGVSLTEQVREALCCNQPQKLHELGFNLETSISLCKCIVEDAKRLDIVDLYKHYKNAVDNNKLDILQLIIVKLHKVYTMNRTVMDSSSILNIFEDKFNFEVDTPSKNSQSLFNLYYREKEMDKKQVMSELNKLFKNPTEEEKEVISTNRVILVKTKDKNYRNVEICFKRKALKH